MTKKLRRRIMLIMMIFLSIILLTIIVTINISQRSNNRSEADKNLKMLMDSKTTSLPGGENQPGGENPAMPDASGNPGMNEPGSMPMNDASGNPGMNEPGGMPKPDASGNPNMANGGNMPMPDASGNPAMSSGDVNPFTDASGNPSDNQPPDKDNSDNNPAKRNQEISISHYILVVYDITGNISSIENTLNDNYTEDDIAYFCEEILSSDKSTGTIEQLRYNVRKTGDSTTIAMIDHSSEALSNRNLLIISIILGLVGLFAFGFLSYIVSGLVVKPVDEAFEKQKRFISDASHELKTPIAVILSNSELLTDQIGENKQVTYIQKECDQMHHLVTSLLDLTKMEQTPYEEVERINFCLSDALLERILPFESVAFEKHIQFEEDIEPDLYIDGAKQQLQQVASILIDNAIQHSEAGGHILVSLTKENHHINLTVTNKGEPIPEEDRKHIFERFYRVDKARNRASGHYGLGLSIAKTIVDKHHGKISVECKDGNTSFIVIL